MNHGSLYSGIGGWLLAARWASIKNVFTCEIDEFCNKVLDKHFPDTDRYNDIKETDFTKYRGTIDILSTSDPCQPFSFAGKRKGKEDDRFLWPQTIKAIQEIRPAYVVFENVPGFISLGFETVASDLEAEGYQVESFIIPACGVGAWHRRDRLWIIAYSDKNEYSELRKSRQREFSPELLGSNIRRFWNREYGPELRRNANGVSSKLDKNRWESLGNSIVPQIAYIIFEAIKEVHKNYENQ